LKRLVLPYVCSIRRNLPCKIILLTFLISIKQQACVPLNNAWTHNTFSCCGISASTIHGGSTSSCAQSEYCDPSVLYTLPTTGYSIFRAILTGNHPTNAGNGMQWVLQSNTGEVLVNQTVFYSSINTTVNLANTTTNIRLYVNALDNCNNVRIYMVYFCFAYKRVLTIGYFSTLLGYNHL